MVVVHVQHRHALLAAVAQGLRRDRGVVQETVAAQKIRPGVVARRAGEGERRARTAQHLVCSGQRAGRATARRGPGARHQRRARVEREQAQARREVARQCIGAESVPVAQRPHRGQGVALRVRRVHGHPLVPGAGQELRVACAVHAGDGSVQRGVVHGRGFQRPERAALQFGQHEVQPRRHFVAGDQTAAEHFLLSLVQGMVGVVEGFHG